MNLGDICVFVMTEGWKIGKVLQFSKIKGKLLSDRQYKGTSAEPRDNIGVLCLKMHVAFLKMFFN